MRTLSDEIFKEYYRKIFKLCLFWLKNNEEAEDITQDIFLKVYEKIENFREESKIYTWIYRISVNTLNNYLRRKKIVEFISFDQNKRIGDSLFGYYKNDPAILAETEYERRDKLKKLESSIEKLSKREKTAFYFYHYENMKQKEIASVMETSVSAIESLIFKSMKKIRRFLA